MHRVYASAPGIVVVNVPGADPGDDVALVIADDCLPVESWLGVLSCVHAALPVCIDGGVEDAADWVTAFERLPAGAVILLDALPDASAARHDRPQLIDGLAALVPPDLTPLQWSPPAG